MSNELKTISVTSIEYLIFNCRGTQIMLDFHLAELYQVETKRLNEQVKRNVKRFPESFRFQLSKSEWEDLQSQIATTENNNSLQSQIATAKRRSLPYVFTEQGVSMLSAVLNSEVAIEISIQIMNAFVQMRKTIQSHHEVYHLGASLKDLGKKWFAFSKLENDSVTILKSIKELI